MKHTFKTENGHLLAGVEFDAEEIKKATNKAIAYLCSNVTVKGYRKGKAPVEVASRYLKNEDVVNYTINELLGVVDHEFYKDAEFTSYNLMPGFRPEVKVDEFKAESAKFSITYVMRPYVSKLGEYKGLKVDAVLAECKDEDVDARIKELAEKNAELVTKEGESANGDIVNIDFTGLINGEEFEGGSAKAFDLTLGSNQFVPGFEPQLVGHKAGDKVDVKVTMPANYPEELANKECLFKVTVNSVKSKEVPAIDDDFATTLTGDYVAKDLAELKEKVKSVIEKENKSKYHSEVINSLFAKVAETSEFVIPEEYLTASVDARIDSENEYYEKMGLTLAEFLKIANVTLDDHKKQTREMIISQLKTSLVYDAIFTAEKIAAPTDKDLEERLGRPVVDFVDNLKAYYKSQSKMTEEEAIRNARNYINQVASSMIADKVQKAVLTLNGFAEEESK